MAQFIQTKSNDKFLVKTDNGFKPFKKIGKTILYEIWEITTTNHTLKCADDHLVYVLDETNETLTETPVKWLTTNDYIIVDQSSTDGIAELVLSVKATGEHAYMYDLLDVEDSRYYTNGILSHNSTTSVAYVLHQILFNDYFNVALLANKSGMAMELLSRLKLSYEKLPLWLQQGILNWNKFSIELENNSKVLAASTSTSSVRGSSFSLIIIDEMAHIPGHVCEDFFTSVYPTISSGKKSKMIITSCVTKDSFVMTPMGIKNNTSFIKGTGIRNYEIPEYKVQGHHGFNTGNIFVNNGMAKTIIIRSQHSLLETSENHKFWACKGGNYGWYESKDLEVGDYIAIKYNTHIYGNNDVIKKIFCLKTVTPKLAYLLGVIISSVFVEDEIIKLKIPRYFDEILEYFNLYYEYVEDSYVIPSKDLLHIIKFYNISFQEIPEIFLEWSKPNIYSLIQAIFDVNSVAYADNLNDNSIALRLPTNNKRFATIIHMLLMNAGIISCLNKNYKAFKDHKEIYYTVFIKTYYAIQYLEEIGFGLEQKQNWSFRYVAGRTATRKHPVTTIDSIPFAFSIFKEKLDPIQLHAAFPLKNVWFITRYKHFSRKRLIGRINTRLKRFQLPWMDEFIDQNIHHTILWSKINTIEHSENEVFDVCLPDIPGDPWCHSVCYNSCVTHQTPRGFNLFYKYWQDAIAGRSGYVPSEIVWSDIPGRDEEFRRNTIAATSLKQFQQEFECLSADTIVTITDEDGIEKTFKLGDLYMKLVNEIDTTKLLTDGVSDDIIDIESQELDN
jgi:hypothetical protein